MPDDEPKNGLLGLRGAKVEELSPQSQRMWADQRRKMAALDLQKYGGGLAFGLGSEFAFEMNLIRFAENQRIDLSKDNWRNHAISRAARQHPQLQPGYRPRGRPKKTVNALASLVKLPGGSEEQQKLIRDVEEIKIIFSDIENNPISDSRAAHWYVVYNYLNQCKSRKLTIPPWGSDELNLFIDSAEFLDQHAAMKMRISRARKAVTRYSR